MKNKTTKKKTKTDKLGRPHNGGRPTKGIDLAELEKLCEMQCTHAEIAHWFGVCDKVIQRRRKVAKFADAMERGYAKGRISLRRQQTQLMESGNVTMAIWLGKQWLGQKDHVEHEHGGTGGGPIEYLSVVLPRMTAEESQ